MIASEQNAAMWSLRYETWTAKALKWSQCNTEVWYCCKNVKRGGQVNEDEKGKGEKKRSQKKEKKSGNRGRLSPSRMRKTTRRWGVKKKNKKTPGPKETFVAKVSSSAACSRQDATILLLSVRGYFPEHNKPAVADSGDNRWAEEDRPGRFDSLLCTATTTKKEI